MEREVLYDNKWIQLCKIDDYVFSSEKRCLGHIVVVFPFIPAVYKTNDKGEEETVVPFQYLARWEATPCHENDAIKFASITGGVEHDDVEGTALLELKEEAGIIASKYELIKLGIVYPSKSQDTIVHLFGVDITGKEIGEATGDGSNHEKNAYCKMSDDIEQLIACKDPLNLVMFLRLAHLKKINIGKLM